MLPGRAWEIAKFQLAVLGTFSSSEGIQKLTPVGVPKAGLMKGGACHAGHALLQLKAGVAPVFGEMKLGLLVNPSFAPPSPGDFSGA